MKVVKENINSIPLNKDPYGASKLRLSLPAKQVPCWSSIPESFKENINSIPLTNHQEILKKWIF